MRDDIKEIKHKADFEGNDWDKLKKWGLKLSLGPIGVDLPSVLEKIFKRK